ncbi:hypothetical protein Tco_0489327 [Tanacetum coccineum]
MLPPNYALSGMKQIKNDYETNVMYDIAKVVGKLQIFVSHTPIDLSTVLIPNNGSLAESLVAQYKLEIYIDHIGVDFVISKYIFPNASLAEMINHVITDYSSENEGIIRQETQNDYTFDKMVEWAEQKHFEYEETKVSCPKIDLSSVLIQNNSSKEESFGEALDEEAILEEQMLALMHRFADRFTDRRVEINNLMVLLTIHHLSNLRNPGWKSKFIFVHEGLFSEQHSGLVTSLRHGLGTFSFPLFSETFDVVLRSRLLHYPFEVQMFPDPVLYLAGYSWEGSPMHLTILVDGHEMTLRDFLYFPGNRSVTLAADPNSTPLSVGSLGILVVDLSDGDVEMLMAITAPALANPSSKGKEVMVSPPYGSKRIRSESLGGDDEAQVSHGILNGLPQMKTQRRLDGLTLNEIANFRDVSALRLGAMPRGAEGRLAAKEDSIVRDLKAKNEKLIIEDDTKSLRSRCPQFKEKEVVMLATEASLKAELEVLKENLNFANEDRSLMVAYLLPHAVKTLLSSDSFCAALAGLQEKAMLVSRGKSLREVFDMSISLKLEDMRDYNPDAKEIYDKAIDEFYRVEFPYLDLLAYHAKKSLGLLKSLKPHPLLLRRLVAGTVAFQEGPTHLSHGDAADEVNSIASGRTIISQSPELSSLDAPSGSPGILVKRFKMSKSIHLDHQDTAYYIPKYHQTPGLSDKDKAIFKNLKRRFFHEGRVVHSSYLDDSNIRQIVRNIDQTISIAFIIRNYEFSLRLHQFAQILRVPCEGACTLTTDWSIASLPKSVDPNPVYLTPLDDPLIVRDAIFN